METYPEIGNFHGAFLDTRLGMKKLLIIILCALASLLAHSQNLVPNPGFEQYLNLPDNIGQWHLPIGWSRVNDGASFNPSPDYWHMRGQGSAQLPFTALGTTYPYMGEAIMGITVWMSSFPNFREYIATELSSPMIIGESYRVTMYITNGTYIVGNSSSAGIDSIGIHFSVDSLFQSGSSTIELNATIVEDSFVYNYNWQRLSYTIVATDTFRFLCIGNFKNDNQTNVQQFDPQDPLGSQAYYFIDEVTVVHVDSCYLDSEIRPSADISCWGMCDGSAEALVSGGCSPYSYTWPTGHWTKEATGLCPGSYVVTITDCNGCIKIDTINIAEPPQLTLLPGMKPDTAGQGVGIAWANASGGTPPFSYQWNDGGTQTTDTAQGLTAGTYKIVVTDSNGCMDSADVIVDNVTGIHDIITQQVSLQCYPNPSNNSTKIVFSVSADEKVQLAVFNASGQLLQVLFDQYALKDKQYDVVFVIDDLENGVYYYRILSSSINRSKKFIINR